MMPGNERSDVDAGGKIIMPPSALDQLTRYVMSRLKILKKFSIFAYAVKNTVLFSPNFVK
jgi:hypothetical protein